MIKFRSWIPLSLVFMVFLAACSVTELKPTSTPVPVAPGKGVISGQVAEADKLWSEGPFYIYAAPFSGDAQGNGFYILEPAIHPSTTLDKVGNFRLANVPPGSYVLVVGPSPDEARQVVDDKGKPRIVSVAADQSLDLGNLLVAK